MRPPDAPDGNGWIRVAEAAALAGVSRQTIHVWIAEGRVPARWGRRGRVIDQAAFERHLQARAAAAEVGVHLNTLRQWTESDTEPM